MKRALIIGGVTIGVLASLATILTSVVYFFPNLNPFARSIPDVSGTWTGALKIERPETSITSGVISMVIESENQDTGVLLGHLRFSQGLSSANDGDFPSGRTAAFATIDSRGHLSFTMLNYAQTIQYTFIRSSPPSTRARKPSLEPITPSTASVGVGASRPPRTPHSHLDLPLRRK